MLRQPIQRHTSTRLARFPLLAMGLLLLLAGLWGGLLRFGWPWPIGIPNASAEHGAIMIGGFLGTLLTLERAVAIGNRWCYLGPLASGAGGIVLLAGGPAPVGAGLILLASVVMVIDFAVILRRQAAIFTVVMGLGAVAWLVGDSLWFFGWSIPQVVFWWIAFLILTIVGERLELSRLLPPTPWRSRLFLAATSIFSAGLVLTVPWPGAGEALAGLGMLALAVWLLVYDLARRTIRAHGLTRFVAACLLPGYFWLAAAGAMACWFTWVAPLGLGAGLAGAPVLAGFSYDAILHAVFLGFVFGMIFGHAPIIFPAVLGIRMRFSRFFYAHLFLLEASVLWRILADLAGAWSQARWAGLLNVTAIVLFLINTVGSLEGRSSAKVKLEANDGTIPAKGE